MNFRRLSVFGKEAKSRDVDSLLSRSAFEENNPAVLSTGMVVDINASVFSFFFLRFLFVFMRVSLLNLTTCFRQRFLKIC